MLLELVENKNTSEFYPTPPELVSKMLDKIDWTVVQTVLEPSAGKGDILKGLAQKENSYAYRTSNFDVDCCEIDPHLREILKYNFSKERKREVEKKLRAIEDSREFIQKTHSYAPLSPSQKYEKCKYAEEKRSFFKNGINIVFDDFLKFTPFTQYDLILMNPPFSEGDKHLLKALELQKRGGDIVCLLNAETIRNPYTPTRKALVSLLNQHKAEIQYISNAFVSAERATDVEIALIRVSIERVKDESTFYEHFKEAEQMEEYETEVTDLEVTDYIKAAIARYNVEVNASIELIRQYQALKPYIMSSLDESDRYAKSLLRLTDSDDKYAEVSINSYLRKVRLKYWKALMSNPKFTNKLTSKLQEEYRNKVYGMRNYDFNEYNIYSLLAEMNSQIKRGVEEEILVMYDRLTEEHSWYPETTQNRHYYDGWATNKAHKIGKKVIMPSHGVFDSWDGRPCVYQARELLEDVERILNYLDGGMTANVESWDILDKSFKQGITKNIQLKYFKTTFYKKGTIHITFTCPELIDRFNIYAGRHKGWLPPSYGKKTYTNMTKDEKAVVDSFQGQEAYNKVMCNPSKYLIEIKQPMMMQLAERATQTAEI